MRFNGPVDTTRFHDFFYMLPEDRAEHLHDSMMGGSHVGMGPGHSDSDAFYHGMHDESMPGRFIWNADGDSCGFQLDADMMPNTDYVMMFRNGLPDHRGGMMQHMGRDFGEDMMVHFRTGDAGGMGPR